MKGAVGAKLDPSCQKFSDQVLASHPGRTFEGSSSAREPKLQKLCNQSQGQHAIEDQLQYWLPPCDIPACQP